MNKKTGAAPATPYQQTETSSYNCGDGYGCQARSTKTRPRAERRGKEGHFYKPLATQFQRDGFNYRQIFREGDAAIYVQGWTGCTDPSVCYEVIRIRRREGFQIGGNFVEPAEVYPRSEAWGVDGFTFTDKDAAFNKFQQVVAGRTGKANQLEQDGDVLDLEQTQTETTTRTETE
jgi:hypothetical protein